MVLQPHTYRGVGHDIHFYSGKPDALPLLIFAGVTAPGGGSKSKLLIRCTLREIQDDDVYRGQGYRFGLVFGNCSRPIALTGE